MSDVIVSNIRLRTRQSMIRFECEPSTCSHAWELHLWDMGDAYCRRCGSLATAENDPRVDRTDGHIRYHVNGEWKCSPWCPGCSALPRLLACRVLVTNLVMAGALCRSFHLGSAHGAWNEDPHPDPEPWSPGRLVCADRDCIDCGAPMLTADVEQGFRTCERCAADRRATR